MTLCTCECVHCDCREVFVFVYMCVCLYVLRKAQPGARVTKQMAEKYVCVCVCLCVCVCMFVSVCILECENNDCTFFFLKEIY